MKKIIVTGGNGMVGSQVKFGIRLSHKQLDILNKKSIEKAVKKYKPDAILHLAALVNVLGCEKNPKKAYELNVLGTENIARVCKKNNIKLIYMSSCAVFDNNKKTPHAEKEIPHPRNVYARTKFGGEKIAKKILPEVLIIRTGLLFGGNSRHKKFVKIFLGKLKTGEDIKVINDRFLSPTYIPDLLKVVENLINKNAKGIYHVVNSGVASYFEIVKEMKKLGKFKSKITPIKARELEGAKLKRGTMEALASSKVKLRSWKTALKESFGG